MRVLNATELGLVSGGYSWSYEPDWEQVRGNAGTYRQQLQQAQGSVGQDGPAGTEDMGFFEFLGWVMNNAYQALGWMADELVDQGSQALADAVAPTIQQSVEELYYNMWNDAMQQAWGNRQ